jgi:hypothetical protein
MNREERRVANQRFTERLKQLPGFMVVGLNEKGEIIMYGDVSRCMSGRPAHVMIRMVWDFLTKMVGGWNHRIEKMNAERFEAARVLEAKEARSEELQGFVEKEERTNPLQEV